MEDEICSYLSYEVKKEIADQYFGFRKLIEEDIREYDDQVFTSFRRLEQKIGFEIKFKKRMIYFTAVNND